MRISLLWVVPVMLALTAAANLWHQFWYSAALAAACAGFTFGMLLAIQRMRTLIEQAYVQGLSDGIDQLLPRET